ncbi:hypothetical protein SRHO_G00275920 [Serrasalmus rhombeus]
MLHSRTPTLLPKAAVLSLHTLRIFICSFKYPFSYHRAVCCREPCLSPTRSSLLQDTGISGQLTFLAPLWLLTFDQGMQTGLMNFYNQALLNKGQCQMASLAPAAELHDSKLEMRRGTIIDLASSHTRGQPSAFVVSVPVTAADEALIRGDHSDQRPHPHPSRRPQWEYTILNRDAPDKPDNIGIVLEGPVVLQEMGTVALAAALFGLMHALNLLS